MAGLFSAMPASAGTFARCRSMLLLIDNYDSFVYNLARYAEELGVPTRVDRNDAITTAEIRTLSPRAIVLSPGPGQPVDAGVSIDIVRELGPAIPILGVCLGHQAIAEAYGGKVIRGEPMHGRASRVLHDGRGVFRGVPSPFLAARYHSLVVDGPSLPSELEVSARLADGTVMGIRHREHPVVGMQFHPESVLTEHGYRVLGNFLHQFARPGDTLARARALSAGPEAVRTVWPPVEEEGVHPLNALARQS